MSEKKQTASHSRRHKPVQNQSNNQQLLIAGLAVLLVIAAIVIGVIFLTGGEDDTATEDNNVSEVDNPSNSNETGDDESNTEANDAPAPLPAEITVSQAYQMREDGVLVVDVREQYEWDNYHVPDAQLIPLGQLPSRLDELPRDQEIIVMCNSGNRSQEGRNILLNAGFTSVTSMDGGIQDWMRNDYPTCFDGSC